VPENKQVKEEVKSSSIRVTPSQTMGLGIWFTLQKNLSAGSKQEGCFTKGKKKKKGTSSRELCRGTALITGVQDAAHAHNEKGRSMGSGPKSRRRGKKNYTMFRLPENETWRFWEGKGNPRIWRKGKETLR